MSEFVLWFLKFECNSICGGEEILEVTYRGANDVWKWSSFIGFNVSWCSEIPNLFEDMLLFSRWNR